MTQTLSWMGTFLILKYITDIQNPGSESMHICNSNVDSEGVRMCHWTVWLIKTNTLNLRTLIFTVTGKYISCVITVQKYFYLNQNKPIRIYIDFLPVTLEDIHHHQFFLIVFVNTFSPGHHFHPKFTVRYCSGTYLSNNTHAGICSAS